MPLLFSGCKKNSLPALYCLCPEGVLHLASGSMTEGGGEAARWGNIGKEKLPLVEKKVDEISSRV